MGGSTLPPHSWGGCPWADGVPRRPQPLPSSSQGRAGRQILLLRSRGWWRERSGSGMLCGARPASVGVGRGGGLQGASAGLWGGPQGGCEAIGTVCVEVQPPVRFAQRQIVSFAETGAFPPPEAQGDRSRQRAGRESDTGAELRKQTGPTPASPLWAGAPSSRPGWEGGPRGSPASGSFASQREREGCPGPARQVPPLIEQVSAPSEGHLAVLPRLPPHPAGARQPHR